MRTYRMVMRQPATRWQDGLPTGNGNVGALMYGRICDEQVLLNHEAVWHRKGEPRPVDLADLLPELRAMIEAERYREAQEFFQAQCDARGGVWCRTDPYQPACDIRVRTDTGGPFRSYRRGIDFPTGVAWTRWRDGTAAYHRELFVSRADDVVVLRMRADRPGQVSCRVSLEPHDGGENRSAGGFAAPEAAPPVECVHSCQGDWLSFSGTFDGGETFGAEALIAAVGGTKADRDGGIMVADADEAIVLVKLYTDEPARTAQGRIRTELEELKVDAAELLTRHAAVHRPIFERMSLQLVDTDPPSNEEMLMEAYDGEAPEVLVQTMFDFGRHLLICSSRSPGWPANLQGVWNGDFTPAWASDYHNDENIQMNYWQALPGNMPEVALPYFDYYERFLDDYRENAKAIYGCRGILLPISQSTNGKMHPGPWANWTGAGAWLGQLYYDYYLFTGDEEFLAERAVPWLREVALFYEDFLFEGPDGKLAFSPSMSPENRPGRDDASLVAINATMDVAICRETLENLCEACTHLDTDAEGVSRWRTMIETLPEYEVNEDGALREWLHPAFPDNYHHRHQSHIYPVFPGFAVTEETDPRIFEACRVAVEKRLVIGLTSQTGWSMAHMANIYARLGMGDRALECLELLTRGSTGPNLFTYHNDWRSMGLTLGGWGRVPPFQIDANFGLSAAVLEMLAFSRPGMVKLLPALPDRWPRGRATGIACRGGVTVDLDWDRKAGRLQVLLRSRQAQRLTVKLPSVPGGVRCTPEDTEVGDSSFGSAYREIALPAGEEVRLDVERW